MTISTISESTITKEELERSICLESFFGFVKRFWAVVVPEDPIWNWHIEFICDEMQKLAERVFLGLPKEYDLVINIPPGSTKALDVDTPIFTTWGWKNHGNLVPGDYVFGPNGKPIKVLAVTSHELAECSDVVFSKATHSIVAANTHLWKTDKNGVVQTDQLKVGERPDSILVNEFPSCRSNRHYVKKVEPCGKRLVNCISVEGELYLAGKDMIATHNSTICSIMFPAWIWTRMPTARSICGSYSNLLSLALSRKTRDVIQSEKYTKLFPGLDLRDDQNTKGHFENHHGGYRFSTSTGGSVTGYHGHFLIMDDPLNPMEAVSEVELKKANDWISRTLSTRKVDKAVTPMILIMQRLHQDDPTAQMLERKKEDGINIRHINLPAEIDERNCREVRPRILRKKYVDGLLDPVRISRSVLKEALVVLFEFGYASQMLQRPVPLSGGLFKIDKIEVAHPPSKWAQKIRFWDKAGTKKGGAFTVGILMGKDMEGCIWILDVIRDQWDSGAREKIIKQTAEIDGHGVIVGVEQEPGSGGKESAENTVKNLLGYTVLIDNPRGNKEARAEPLSIQVNIGNVKIAKAEWNRAYLSELQYFPNSKYKDQVDASSGAFTTLTQPGKGRIGVF